MDIIRSRRPYTAVVVIVLTVLTIPAGYAFWNWRYGATAAHPGFSKVHGTHREESDDFEHLDFVNDAAVEEPGDNGRRSKAKVV